MDIFYKLWLVIVIVCYIWFIYVIINDYLRYKNKEQYTLEDQMSESAGGKFIIMAFYIIIITVIGVIFILLSWN